MGNSTKSKNNSGKFRNEYKRLELRLREMVDAYRQLVTSYNRLNKTSILSRAAANHMRRQLVEFQNEIMNVRSRMVRAELRM